MPKQLRSVKRVWVAAEDTDANKKRPTVRGFPAEVLKEAGITSKAPIDEAADALVAWINEWGYFLLPPSQMDDDHVGLALLLPRGRYQCQAELAPADKPLNWFTPPMYALCGIDPAKHTPAPPNQATGAPVFNYGGTRADRAETAPATRPPVEPIADLYTTQPVPRETAAALLPRLRAVRARFPDVTVLGQVGDVLVAVGVEAIELETLIGARAVLRRIEGVEHPTVTIAEDCRDALLRDVLGRGRKVAVADIYGENAGRVTFYGTLVLPDVEPYTGPIPTDAQLAAVTIDGAPDIQVRELIGLARAVGDLDRANTLHYKLWRRAEADPSRVEATAYTFMAEVAGEKR